MKATLRSKGSAFIVGTAAVVTMLAAVRGDAGGTTFEDRICEGVFTGVYYDTDRVEVSCSNPGNGIVRFAIAGATSRAASQALAVALTARASGRGLYIRYETAPSQLAGCDTNCRKLLWISDWH